MKLKKDLSLLAILLASTLSYAKSSIETQSVNIDILEQNPSQLIKNYSYHNKDYRFTQLTIEAFNVPSEVSLLISSNTSGEQYFYSNIENGKQVLQSIDSNDITVTVSIPSTVNIPDSTKLVIKDINFFMSFNELNSRALIGADNRKRLACYKGSDIYDWGLSSVIVSGGSGASIGSGNLFLTNNHVMGDVGPMARETWFNWHHYECEDSNEVKTPLRLPTTQNIASGSQNGTGDWTLYQLHEFDLNNSEAKRLFGGLKLSNNNALYNDPLIIPQYGNGGFQPTVVAVESDNKNTCNVTGMYWNMVYDCDTQAGSSGSSVLSASTGEVVGVHYASSGSENYGVNISSVWTAGSNIIKPEENIAVAPSPYPVYVNYIDTSPFSDSGTIKAFNGPVALRNDKLILNHNKTYTNVSVNVLDEKNNQVIEANTDLMPIKMWLEQNNTQYPLNAINQLSDSPVSLKFHAPSYDELVARSWIVFDVENSVGEIISHEVIKFNENWFDIMTPPFNPELNDTIQYTLDLSDSYQEISYRAKNLKDGLLSFYPQQGPTAVTWADTTINKLPIVVENINTLERDIIYLEAFKDIGCGYYSMNSGVYCGNINPIFKVTYSPQLNSHLKSGVYRAILPLQSRHIDTNQVRDNILISINLTVKAENNTPPKLVSTGAANILVGNEFIPSNHVHAIDNEDGDITRSVIALETIDTSIAGSHSVTFQVTDSSGETATLQTYINVILESDLATSEALTSLQALVTQAESILDVGQNNCSDLIWNELIYMINMGNLVLNEPYPSRQETLATSLMLSSAIDDAQSCSQ